MSLFGKPAEPKRPEPGAPGIPRVNTAAPAPVAAPSVTPAPRPASACVIGAKTTVKGDLLGDEDVQVDGTVEGLVRISRDLKIGTSGVVRATVEAASVVISGELVGDCKASVRVEIHATGRLTGNIRAPKIVIAEGAMFRGNSDMSGSGAA
jgi:cytoskeletal protein CcmA (bactofilin family)